MATGANAAIIGVHVGPVGVGIGHYHYHHHYGHRTGNAIVIATGNG